MFPVFIFLYLYPLTSLFFSIYSAFYFFMFPVFSFHIYIFPVLIFMFPVFLSLSIFLTCFDFHSMSLSFQSLVFLVSCLYVFSVHIFFQSLSSHFFMFSHLCFQSIHVCAFLCLQSLCLPFQSVHLYVSSLYVFMSL